MRSFAGIVPPVVLVAALCVSARAAAAPSTTSKPLAAASRRPANASDRLWDAWDKSLETKDSGPLRALLEQVKDVNLKDRHGITPLAFAAMAGFNDLADRLLERGADPDTALPMAAVYDRWILFSNLLRRGAHVNQADEAGGTPLMAAAAEPKGTRYVRLLLQKGAEVNAASKEGFTALMMAASSGSDESVYLLLQKKAAVNARNGEGKTALMLAAEEGKTFAVQRLLQGQADPNLATRDGSTALTFARQRALIGEEGPLRVLEGVSAKAPPQHLLEALIQKDAAAARAALARGEDPNGPEKDGTPLTYAIALGSDDDYTVAKAIIEAGADVNRVAVSMPPLVMACKTKRLDLVKLLLDHKANINAAAENGYTPLMMAAMEGQADLVKLLLARGADVRLKIPHGETALDLALEHKADAVAALLRDAGAPEGRPARVVAPPKPREKSLAQAIYDNDPEGVRAALARGEDPDPRVSGTDPYVILALTVGTLNQWKAATLKPLLEGHASPSRADAHGMTPLMSAALYPTLEPTRLLLEYGAEVNARTEDGQSALVFAALSGNVETMKLLLEKGAKLEGMQKKDPLLVALVRDLRPGQPKPEVLKLLLDRGANVDIANAKGETALMVAAKYGQLEAVKILLEKGADPNLTTKDGRTALSMALKARKTAVVATLKKAGAKR